MSTPAPTAEHPLATSGACRARAVVADHAERNAMIDLVAERIYYAANEDGAIAGWLLVEEARNLACAVVDLIEECQPRHLTAEILSELRSRPVGDFDHQAQIGQGPPA